MTELVLTVVIGTSLWVLIDSRSCGVRKGVIKGFFDMGRAGWFFCCLLLWIVAFPAYLVKRDEYRQALAKRGSGADNGPQTTDVLSQISKLAQLRAQGALTEEEFQAKKTELLARM
jgi:uncharacterized membrane protein